MEQPIYFWTPDIAPSGLMFYTGRLFPAWKGNIFIGALAGKHLVRLVMKNGRVAAEESLLADRCVRFREVRQGPEGAIYILTDQDNAQVLRLTP
jgi:glucose/arabinose dehydrogenase